MSEMEESSKAVAEVAKFGTTAVEAGVKLGGFFSKVLGEPFQDAVGLLGDRLKLYRFQNQVMIMDKVNRTLDERGVTKTRPISPKFLIPIMEYASLEEDESLQDMWCRLLANGLDPSRNFEFKYSYIEIIKSLTPLDAVLLKYIYDNSIYAAIDREKETNEPVSLTECPINFYKIWDNNQIRVIDIRVSLCNLMRVQCINEVSVRQKVIATKSGDFYDHLGEAYAITSLGFDFMKSCMT
jgi:ferredoxin-like protein FixX